MPIVVDGLLGSFLITGGFRSSAETGYADFLEAAVAWLKADSTLVALLPGGIHADEAPPRVSLPYLVISEPDSDSRDESEGKQVEPIRVQCSIFAASKTTARLARQQLVTTLRDASLTFTGGTLLHLRDANRTGLFDPDRGPGGCDVWQEIQFFAAVVGRG